MRCGLPWRAGRAALPLVALALVCAACATPAAPPTTTVPVTARPETVAAVRRSVVQRVVKDAPAVIRSGVARLVSTVPLDEQRVGRLAPAMAQTLFAERLETETAHRLEAQLSAADIQALVALLDDEDVKRVVAAAVTPDPERGELERYVQDARSRLASRRDLVKALMEVTWSATTVDRLGRAPAKAVGRIVAAAVPDNNAGLRAELLRLDEQAPPGDIEAQVMAFMFLWRDLDDVTLEGARAAFSSELGLRSTAALVDAAALSVEALSAEIEARVR